MSDAAQTQPWTTRRLLGWITAALTAKGVESARLMGEMLVSHVIGCDRLKLYMDTDRPASPLELDQLRELVRRALAHEPAQYLVGEAWFYGLRMRVDRRVLIPRPCTETIVERVLRHAREHPGFIGPRGDGALIADVATGSGAIAVALLVRLPDARAIATDLSADALEVAMENARSLGVSDRLELIRGDLLEPVLAHPVAGRRGGLHYLVSNPPYIPDDEWAEVSPGVAGHEPEMALRGGPDGMDLVAPVIQGGPALVRSGGLMLVEVASARAETARVLAASVAGVREAVVLTDADGLARVVEARV